MGFLQSAFKAIPSVGRSLAIAAGVAAATVFTSIPTYATDPVTLPSTGVDVGGYATAAITSLGAVVAVCVGGVVAFMLVRAGIRWVRGIK